MIRRGQQAHRSQGAFYYGDLWQYLYDGLPGGAVRFGRTIESLGDDPTRRPTIDGTVYDLVVLADGGWSGLRPHVTSTQPHYTGYVVWRGLVDAAAVPRYNTFGVFKAGIYDTIVMPLAGDGLGLFIATPEVEAHGHQCLGRRATRPPSLPACRPGSCRFSACSLEAKPTASLCGCSRLWPRQANSARILSTITPPTQCTQGGCSWWATRHTWPARGRRSVHTRPFSTRWRCGMRLRAMRTRHRGVPR